MRTHKEFLDGKLVSEIPYKLSEEINADGTDYFKQMTSAITGGGALPKDIDEWNSRYNPQLAFEAQLTAKGIDKSKVSQDILKIGALFMDFGYKAVCFMHGKPPGMQDDV